MYQTIGETISVVGIYARRRFTPRKFLWQGREYPVQEITFVTDQRDGATRKRTYSVVSGANVYRLLFDRSEESWLLQELWVE